MKNFFLFVSLVSYAVVSGQGLGSDTSRKVVRITRPQYSLNYPDSWRADTSKMFGADLFIYSPKLDSLDQFTENVNVYVQDLSGQNYFLSKMGKQSEAQIKNMVTDVEILESRLDSTSTNQYYVLKYRGRQGKFLLTTEQRYFLKNDLGVALTFTVQSGKEEEYRMTSLAILDSFVLF